MSVQPVSLGELLTLVRRKVDVVADGQYPEIGVRSYGRGLFHKQPRSGLEVGDKELFLVHEGDFILQVTFAWEGAVAVAQSEDHGLYGSVRMLTFQADENRCLPEFLQFYFRTPEGVEQLVRISPGSAGRNRVLNKSRLPEVFVPLPPLAEQQRIVAKIARLAGKVEKARGLREQAAAESDSLVDSAARVLLGELVSSPRVKLKSVCSEIIDCLHSNPLYSDTGIPTVRSPDVGWGVLLLDQARRTSEAEYSRRTQRGEPQPGDIIIVREGGGTGKAGIVQEGQKLSLGQRVIQVRLARERVLPTFFLYQWLSPMIQQDQIAERIKGSASPHLNIGAVKDFDFLLPPMDKQERVVSELDRVQGIMGRLQVLQAQTAAGLDALLPAILDRAFKGEL